MTERKPEPTWNERKLAARRFGERMTKYAIRKDGRRKLSDAVFRDMLSRFDGNLRSASIPARIAFARAARRSARLLIPVDSRHPAFMVTLVPQNFAFPYPEALKFDWTELQRWSAGVLHGLDYFGIVEVSYYTAHPVPNMREDMCHFHVHALVWNARRSALEAIRRRVNRDFPAFLPGRNAMRIDACPSTKVLRRKLAYFLKPLMTEYRGYPLKGAPPARWKQKKRDLRSGKAANALQIFHGIDIDHLCISGGAGDELLNASTRRAKARLVERENRSRMRLASLIS